MTSPASRTQSALLTVILALLTGCGGHAPYVWAVEHPSLTQPPAPHTLAVGDRFTLLVADHAELSGEFAVTPEGKVVHPVLGAIPARGMTTEALEKVFGQHFTRFVAEPKVTVVLLTTTLHVSALGEVTTPGQFVIDRGESVLDVLGRAGGLTAFADPSSIFLVRARSGERIRFRYDDLTRPDASASFRLMDGDALVVE